MSAADLRLVPAAPADREWLERLYLSAFPPEERAPFSRVWKRMEQKKADFLVLADGAENVGFAYMVSGGGLAYLFFLAIEPGCRGKGYGTAALKILLERYREQTLFIALEPRDDETAENREERLKRHDFYLRCGLRDQPGRIVEVGYAYAIMTANGAVAPEAYRKLIRRWLGWPVRMFLETRMTGTVPDSENDRS